MTTSTADATLELSREAQETVQSMLRHVQTLEAAYGVEHKWVKEARDSLLHVLSDLFCWHGTLVVTKDFVDRSLVCFIRQPNGGTGLVFGLIFHSTRRHCTNDECDLYANDDGTTFHYRSHGEQRDCGDHKWLYPLTAPTPGTWSFHS